MPAPARPCLHGMPMTWAFTHMIDAFEERAGHCGSDAELRDLLEAALRELGFDYFALLHHASLTTGRTGLIRIDNYPSGWAVELAPPAILLPTTPCILPAGGPTSDSCGSTSAPWCR